jgi:hypothetical protein
MSSGKMGSEVIMRVQSTSGSWRCVSIVVPYYGPLRAYEAPHVHPGRRTAARKWRSLCLEADVVLPIRMVVAILLCPTKSFNGWEFRCTLEDRSGDLRSPAKLRSLFPAL